MMVELTNCSQLFADIIVDLCDLSVFSGAQVCKSYRSQKLLRKNSLPKIGFDTSENDTSKVIFSHVFIPKILTHKYHMLHCWPVSGVFSVRHTLKGRGVKKEGYVPTSTHPVVANGALRWKLLLCSFSLSRVSLLSGSRVNARQD